MQQTSKSRASQSKAQTGSLLGAVASRPSKNTATKSSPKKRSKSPRKASPPRRKSPIPVSSLQQPKKALIKKKPAKEKEIDPEILLEYTFKLFDHNKDGFVTKDEFFDIFRCSG